MNPTPVAWMEEFKRALNGGRGDFDAWLECYDEAECRLAINAVINKARADALREAADVFGILGGASCEQLRRMADEMEKGK